MGIQIAKRADVGCDMPRSGRYFGLSFFAIYDLDLRTRASGEHNCPSSPSLTIFLGKILHTSQRVLPVNKFIGKTFGQMFCNITERLLIGHLAENVVVYQS